MNIRQVQKGLRSLGVRIPDGTLRRWSASGLVPSPQGRRNAQWSDWTLATAAAAAFLIHRAGWSAEQVQFCRLALAAELESGRSIVQVFLSKYKTSPELKSAIFQWLMAVLKAHLGKPLDSPMNVYAKENTDTRIVVYQPDLSLGTPGSVELFVPNVKWLGQADVLRAGGWKFAGPAVSVAVKNRKN